jgi:hypothetical protein
MKLVLDIDRGMGIHASWIPAGVYAEYNEVQV